MTYAVVVPTVGRPTLTALLDSLAASHGPLPAHVVVVDDRPDQVALDGPAGLAALPAPPPRLVEVLVVRRGGGRGPAAARNVGWRAVAQSCEWIVFLDDDVVVSQDWLSELADDLQQPADVAGVQGEITVPLPRDRRPTDWERSTAGLQTAAWITADMGYRRPVLEQLGGFDERFPRAFREDADIALRVQRCGGRLVRGRRRTTHPVRSVDRWASVRAQRGNADDPLMRRVHGAGWRRSVQAPPGRLPLHAAVTAAAGLGLAAAASSRPRLAAVAAASWLAGTGHFAWTRIARGPRTPDEITAMLLTSAVIPPVATWHRLRGEWRHRSAGPWMAEPTTRAVLFDRDGTLVHDVPYNSDPSRVRPVEGAVELVADLRARGIRTGVVTNQSGVGRGLLTEQDVRRVNARVDELFGGFDVWAVCPHIEDDRCECRKPAPGMVLKAAAELGVPPAEVVVIGDIGADVEAAVAAGAQGILVPTPATRAEEVAAAAPRVAGDLASAVAMAVGPAP